MVVVHRFDESDERWHLVRTPFCSGGWVLPKVGPPPHPLDRLISVGGLIRWAGQSWVGPTLV